MDFWTQPPPSNPYQFAMSYTFQFESEGSADIKSGDRCEFYAGFPATASQLVGEADPMSSTTLNSSFQATLSNAGSKKEIAIVLKRSDSTYARSNSIALSK